MEQRLIRLEESLQLILNSEKIVKLYKGVNQIISRFWLSQKLLSLNTKPLYGESINVALKGCLDNLENPKADIRKEVISLVVLLARLQGKQPILKFFSVNNLRPNIYSTIEEKLGRLEAGQKEEVVT